MAASRRLLVAVDVDGTLLNTEFDDELAPRVVQALQSVRDAGHVLALCTGRNTRSVGGLLEKSGWFPEDLPLVLLNGALVRAGNPRRQLVCNELDGELIRQLLPLFLQHGTVPMVYGTDADGGVLHHQTSDVNRILDTYISARRNNVGAIEAVPDITALAWRRALEVGTIDEEERIRALTADIKRELAGQVNVINTRSLLGKGRYYWAEVYRAGSDKGTGLRSLATEYDFPLDRTVAIGDNYNDLAMFDLAGCSVAMGNSPDEVKARADQVVEDVAEGGAARVLEGIAEGRFPCL